MSKKEIQEKDARRVIMHEEKLTPYVSFKLALVFGRKTPLGFRLVSKIILLNTMIDIWGKQNHYYILNKPVSNF